MQMLGDRVRARLNIILVNMLKIFDVNVTELSGTMNPSISDLMYGKGRSHLGTDEVFMRDIVRILNALNIHYGITEKVIALRIPDGDLLLEFRREYEEDHDDGFDLAEESRLLWRRRRGREIYEKITATGWPWWSRRHPLYLPSRPSPIDACAEEYGMTRSGIRVILAREFNRVKGMMSEQEKLELEKWRRIVFSADSQAKRRSAHSGNHSARDIAEIKKAVAAGESIISIAKRMRLTYDTVYGIVKRGRYPDV